MPLQLEAPGFDLPLTLTSGQFFRYYQDEDNYLLVTDGRVITVRQERSKLLFDGTDEQHLRRLFQLVPEHDLATQRLMKDPVLSAIIPRYTGLRVMRINLHETILGFICSSASNIPKIRMNLHLLSQLHGTQVQEHWLLPAPGKALDHAIVTKAKTGYRAKYLVETNRLLTRKLLTQLQTADYPTSHALLCELPGIGPKIADCICLFSLGHGEAFPVDVHILRAMRHLFSRARLTNEARAKAFAQKRWGKDAGIAQQFIFQWARDERSRLI
jgi:N-glycosylase/DNA lyase